MSNERTAIDTALIKLGLASQYLEVNRPSKADVKKSSEAAKDAAEILKASLVLLDHDVYTVQEAPQEATPLFQPTGEPTAAAEIVPLPPLPEELAVWDGTDEAEQLNLFERRLDALADVVPKEPGVDASGQQGVLDYAPWDVAWTLDHKDAFTRLLVAEAREVKSFEVPSDEERDTWLAQFAAPILEVAGRKFKVGDRVKATANAALADDGELGDILEDDGSPENESPYFVHLDSDEEGGGAYFNAEDIELVTPDDETLAEPFPEGTKPTQKKVFEERLATLEDIFCERLNLAGNMEPMGKQLALFRPHRDAWKAAWKADPKKAWVEILKAIVEANKVGTEFTSWAPAA